MPNNKPDNATRKAQLVTRVEEFLTTKGTTQRQKKCSECGKGFLGRDDAVACSEKCRQKKSRA